MTIELHLLRHGNAGDPSAWRGSDFDRPLTARGRDQAERLGTFLAQMGFAPDAVITSPLARARQTAEHFAEPLGAKFRVDDRLGARLSPAAIEAILSDAGNPSRPVLVGHDPDFSDMAGLLIGAVQLPVRKGAIARIDIARPLTPSTGILRWLVTPELLERRKPHH